ncbi:hypothetical protein [Pajaroellobacter abortibovis]|uniref:Uncharacterized protein n=1 Tax=Pajaroellobacter abortibovis TaxID=1882918 RepID=A0A1L6MW93_9BACT|nr:hypothetical protein [Pajaroellobacter abortibovis]APR99708.1 hypothetical protein BCY86_02730 [Pajaroellobacter abortibovis]
MLQQVGVGFESLLWGVKSIDSLLSVSTSSPSVDSLTLLTQTDPLHHHPFTYLATHSVAQAAICS